MLTAVCKRPLKRPYRGPFQIFVLVLVLGLVLVIDYSCFYIPVFSSSAVEDDRALAPPIPLGS